MNRDVGPVVKITLAEIYELTT
uniref:Uncharacterized protein n=1 Tax=Arundo donax TaxID=35708 RepID=A0A0A9CDL8_ARUDO